MAKTKISEFSATPGNNTDIDGINLAEGCAPSGINDAIRELMAQLKDWQSGTSGDSFTIGSPGTLTYSSGTANGVAYLNGSKVLTTGSALTFDGTTFQVAAARGTYALNIYNSSDGSIAGQFGSLTGNVFGINATGPANTMTFLTGGSEQMRLTSTGLGIGTSSPGYKADVLSSNFKGLRVQSSGDDAIITMGSQIASSQYWSIIATSNTSGQGANRFLINTTDANAGGTSTTRLMLDASGNLGVGTSSPSTKLHVLNTTAVVTEMRAGNSVSYASLLVDGTGASQLFAPGGTQIFNVNGSERARIDSSGNLLVGASSGNPGARLYLVGDSSPTFIQTVYDTRTDNNPGGGAIGFQRRVGTGSPSFVGSITTSTTSTAYNTSSDYRLKENIQPMTGALAKVASLKPCTYKWKVDGSDGEGFIAHELAEVVPQCVTGEKDAVDAEGNPVYQGIDTSFLVATLTAALQEAVAEINQLKADVAALKAK